MSAICVSVALSVRCVTPEPMWADWDVSGFGGSIWLNRKSGANKSKGTVEGNYYEIQAQSSFFQPLLQTQWI